MEISVHNMTRVEADSGYGESASWVELTVTEKPLFGKESRFVIALFTAERNAILCARLAQAINQVFSEETNEAA